jgi:hypothetical protein
MVNLLKVTWGGKTINDGEEVGVVKVNIDKLKREAIAMAQEIARRSRIWQQRRHLVGNDIVTTQQQLKQYYLQLTAPARTALTTTVKVLRFNLRFNSDQ